MGIDGTFLDALAGVEAFNAACVEDDDSKQQKHSNKKHSKKSKHSKKEKTEKNSRKKKKKKSRKHASSDSDEDRSDSDDAEKIDVNVQLARGREAVKLTRHLVAVYPSLRRDLREILRRIDSGEGVDIRALPDEQLKENLYKLFDNLSLRKDNQGLYSRSYYHSSVVSFLGPVLDEEPAIPATSLQDVKTTSSQPTTNVAVPQAGNSRPAADPLQESLTSTSDSEAHEEQQEVADGADRHETGDEGDEAVTMEGIGPGLPSGWAPTVEEGTAVEGGVDEEGIAEGSGGSDDERPAPGPTRFVGPAVPPPEVLAAAAAMQIPLDDDEDDEPLIGPPPPEFVQQFEAASGDERAAEVVRVMNVLNSAAAGSSEEAADAYDILGVDPEAAKADVKKRYWKVSLLIHPDKCDHPMAHTAFQAVSTAAKHLQDESARKAIDQERENKRLTKLAAEFDAQQERERQWRVVRGTASKEDMAGPINSAAPSRDTWMTHLPAVRQAGPVSQVSVRAFNQRGVQQRESAGWTSTPQDSVAQLGMGQGPALLQYVDPKTSIAASAAVDKFNSATRGKTLLEKHQDRLKGAKKAKKRKAGESEADKDKDKEWADKHPWRPFDREKDLQIGGGPMNTQDLLKKAGNLSSRFGGDDGRRFL